jgi:transcriptional regulator with XRE-family HTH domain
MARKSQPTPRKKDPARASKAPHPNEAEQVLSGTPPLSWDIGHRIAGARAVKGWTQAQLAEKLGKSRGTVVQYEQGKIEPPLRQIQRMAELLDVAPEMLAFGRQGISGLDDLKARVATVAEISYQGPDEIVMGAFGLPEHLVEQRRIDLSSAKVIEVEHAAPGFGLTPGDRVLVQAMDDLEQEDALYVLRTPRGLDVVRLLPNLSSQRDLVKINDGSGETHSYERGELNVVGRVLAALRFV